MAGSYFKLGQLDCLQNMHVPQAVGDVDVRMTYPDYRDTRFQGFGLQTPSMDYEVFTELFGSQNIFREVRQSIIHRAGIWQIECPEVREIDMAGFNLFGRGHTDWHSDNFPNRLHHRLLVNDRRCNATGETDLTTTRIAFLIRQQRRNLSDFQRERIGKYLSLRQEYSPEAARFFRSLPGTGSDSIIQECRENPASVVRQFYRHSDFLRPMNISAYSAVAWDDASMIHASPLAKGKLAEDEYTC